MNMLYLGVPVAQRKGPRASPSMTSAAVESVGQWTVPFMVILGTVASDRIAKRERPRREEKLPGPLLVDHRIQQE